MLEAEKHGPATMVFVGTVNEVSPGLDGLFPDSADTVIRQVTSTSDKPALIEEVTLLIGEQDEDHALLGQKAALMLDEMLENAFYAAPRTPEGKPRYDQRLPRAIANDEQVLLRYRYDGVRLFLEVRDSWGSLTQGQVFSYLAVNTQEKEPDPDRTGRGLFFMWWMFDHFYVRIYPGQETAIGGSLLLQKARSDSKL